jgi:SAM-dependent methyltransferase
VTALPLDLYDIAIGSHTGSDACGCGTWRVRYADGRARPLPLARWCSEPDAVDRGLLARCARPTLDVGCGPGRLVAALAAEGHDALGVDVAAAAVRLARRAGATAVRRSVFDSLPDEGHWGTVLLADGNIGIGGDPVALLRRCRDLLRSDGLILVELDPPGATSVPVQVRLEVLQQRSSWFDWAHVAADRIDSFADHAGLRVIDSWTMNDRWFACLAR